jgi:hypothetical protein
MGVEMRWTDEALFGALGRYEQICIDNRMKQNAIDSYRTYAKRFLEWRKGDYWPRGASKPKQRPTPLIVGTSDLRGEAETYVGVVEAAGRAQDTIDTYHRHALFFVRWLEGTFVPGATLKAGSPTGPQPRGTWPRARSRCQARESR